MTQDLRDKTAIVTGSSRGIGRQIAIEFAKRGADVAICHGSPESSGKATEVAKVVRSLGSKAAVIQCDLRSIDCGTRIVESVLVDLEVKHIDILVNNAAIDPPQPTACTDQTIADFEGFMQVNARAPMLLVQAVVPHLPPSGGRIISISSVLARTPAEPFSAWASSKAALECLSRYWAAELGTSHGLTSNVVSIGPTVTEYHANDPPELIEELSNLPSAAKRLATPDGIALIVSFLASDGARWINGDTIAGNGGIAYR